MLKVIILEAQQLLIDRGYDTKIIKSPYKDQHNGDTYDVTWVCVDHHSKIGFYEKLVKTLLHPVGQYRVGAIITTYGHMTVYSDKPVEIFEAIVYVDILHKDLDLTTDA